MRDSIYSFFVTIRYTRVTGKQTDDRRHSGDNSETLQLQPGTQRRLQSRGVQFLGLGYYYPSTGEKLERSTQFGAVGYIITLYSPKSYGM